MAPPLQPRRWLEFILEPYPEASATTYRWGTRPIAGTHLIEGRIPLEGWETILRRASSMGGEYHIDNASVVLSDRDALIRALLDSDDTQWFLNREGAFKLLSEAGLAASLAPRLLFGGYCTDAQILEERRARLEFEDVLSQYLDRLYPQYTLGDAYPFRFEGRDEGVDEDLNTTDPGVQIPLALRDQVMPVYMGPFIDSAVDPITGIQRSKGLIPTFYMGYTSLTAGTGTMPEPSPELAVILTGNESDWGGWGELFVALGEYDIPNVYISNGVGFSTGPPGEEHPARVRCPEDHYGIDVIAPGHPGWPFDTDYVMRNGFRCTVIYARGPVLWHHITGVVNITVDVCGWKNSEGEAVDQAGYVYQEFITQHVLAHEGAGYTSGPNAGLPLFEDGRAMFWTSKVQAWQAMTAERLGTAKGYLCSMALTEPTSLREILRTWHVTFDAFSAKNGAGQLYPFSINDLADVSEGVMVRERTELRGLPAPKIGWDEIENWIEYTVGWDPEQKTPRTPTLKAISQSSIDALKGSIRRGGTRRPPIRSLRYTADDATALDVIGRRLIRLRQAPRYQALPVRTDGVDREIGEQVRVSHQDGIGLLGIGYDARPFVILEHRHTGHEIELLAIDVAPIIAGAGVIADTVDDWASASSEERGTLFFISDEDDMIPGNGPGSELR